MRIFLLTQTKGGYMKYFFIIPMLLLFCSCAGNQNIYVDGLPISDHEYTAKTPSGLTASFQLTRYYQKQFDEETMLYPEYLDLWDENVSVDASKTEALILHIKLVNINRIPIMVWYIFEDSSQNKRLILYQGRLPRKDIALSLPIVPEAPHEYEIIISKKGEELLSIWGKYKTRGVTKKKVRETHKLQVEN